MPKIINWLKNNKILAFLLAVVFYLLFVRNGNLLNSNSTRSTSYQGYEIGGISSLPAVPEMGVKSENAPSADLNTAQIYSQSRKVVTNTSLGILVKNVPDVIKSIKNRVNENLGYVINISTNLREYGADAVIEVRVPNDKLDTFLDFVRKLSIKVTYENITGYDVTDQYTDLESDLILYKQNKMKFEEFMWKAENVDQMLQIQQKIINQQRLIDSTYGQLKYLDKTSNTTKVTLYVSTDEIGLPYKPLEPWRPEVIFKQATRSMVGMLQQLGTLAIWSAVYSVVIIPALIILVIVKKSINKRYPPKV